MHLKQLRYFLKVVERKSFARAAEDLYISQTALGLQIRRLEEEFDIPLLARHSRGVTPTDAGLLLAKHAARILDETQKATRALKDLPGRTRHKIALGMVPAINAAIAEPLIGLCAEELPQASLSIVEQLSYMLKERVASGELDMALVYGAPSEDGVTAEALFKEKLFFVEASQGSARTPVRFKDLGKRPLILSGTRHGTRSLVETLAAEHGVRLNIAIEMSAVEAGKRLVEHGAGCAILPLGAVAGEIADGKLIARPIIEPEITRMIYLISRNASALSPTETTLQGFIRRLLSDEALRAANAWFAV